MTMDIETLLEEAETHLEIMERGPWTTVEQKAAFAKFAAMAMPILVRLVRQMLDAGRQERSGGK